MSMTAYASRSVHPLRDPWLWLFTLVALVFLFAAPLQLFPIPGWVDAGMYLGYGTNLHALVERFGFTTNTYQGMRLSYVLPLYVWHHLLSPLPAQYAQIACWYLLALVSAMALGHQRGGRAGALACGALLAFNPLFLSALTFGGSDGATVAYVLAAAACAFSACGLRHERRAMALAGAFAGLALASHLFIALQLLVLAAAHALVATPAGTGLSLWRRYGLACVMALGTFGLLAIMGIFLGIPSPLFYLRMVGSSLFGIGGNYRLPLASWLFDTTRLLAPVAVLLWCFRQLLPFTPDTRRRWLAVLLLVAAPPLLMLAYDLVLPGVTLQTRPYFALLIPGWIIALSLSCSGKPSIAGDRASWLPPVIFLGVAIVVALAGKNAFALTGPGMFFSLVLALGVAALGLWRSRPSQSRSHPGVWLLSLIVLCTSATLVLNKDTSKVFKAATGLDYREAYLGAIAFTQAMEKSALAARRPRLIYDREPLNQTLGEDAIYPLKFANNNFRLNYFDTLASLYLWNKSLVSPADPSAVAALAGQKRQAPEFLVLLGRDPAEVSAHLQRLQQLGLSPQVVDRASYTGRQFGWQAAFVRLPADNPAATPPAVNPPALNPPDGLFSPAIHFSFSETNPLRELSIGLSFIALAGWLLTKDAARRRWQAFTDAVAAFAVRRAVLPFHGLAVDYRKLDLVRIAVGYLATLRHWEIVHSSLHGGGVALALAVTGLVCSLAIMAGWFTPVFSFLLMVLGNTVIDNYLGSSTLGSMVLSMILLIFVLAPAGTTLSLDALLLRNLPKIPGSRVLGHIYRLAGATSEKRLLLSLLAGMLAYYMLCLYSVLVHLHDPAWLSGHVTSWLMLSPVFNPQYHQAFDAFYQAAPGIFAELGRWSMYGMIFWYVTFLPGLFCGKLIRTWIIYWSLAFWLLSTFVLPLSYLGYYELCLWFLLFFSHGMLGRADTPRLLMVFDDRCNLCTGTVKFLKAVDLFYICDFRPVSENHALLAQHGLSVDAALRDIVGIDPASGRVRSGYALYDWLCGHLLLLWPGKPLFWLGRLSGIGPLAYRLIADRRTRLFGVCERADPDLPRRPENLAVRFSKSAAYPLAFYAMLLAIVWQCGLYAIRLPVNGEQTTRAEAWLSRKIGSSSLVFGLWKINVFNLQDLNLGQVKIQLLVDGQPIEKFREQFVNVATGSLSAIVTSDSERYRIVGYSRVNSQTNLRCNPGYFDIIAPLLRRQLGPLVKEQGVTAEVYFVAGAALGDLDAHRYVPATPRKICAVRFQDDTLRPYAITYYQQGIDALLKSTGQPELINAHGAALIQRFPCRQERRYFSLLFDRYGDRFPDRAQMAARIRAMNTSSAGESELQCVIELATIGSKLTENFSASGFPPAIPGRCDAEIALAKDYARALRTVYPPVDTNGLAEKLDALDRAPATEAARKAYASPFPALHREASESAALACVARFATLRREFWGLLTK